MHCLFSLHLFVFSFSRCYVPWFFPLKYAASHFFGAGPTLFVCPEPRLGLPTANAPLPVIIPKTPRCLGSPGRRHFSYLDFGEAQGIVRAPTQPTWCSSFSAPLLLSPNSPSNSLNNHYQAKAYKCAFWQFFPRFRPTAAFLRRVKAVAFNFSTLFPRAFCYCLFVAERFDPIRILLDMLT